MAETSIPMVNVAKEIQPLRSQIDKAISKVLDSGRFIQGPEVVAFEEELASMTGSKFAVGVSSGTDALLCSLMGMDVGQGDEIVTTAFTFFATGGVVARLGAKLVFADIDPDNFCLDPNQAISKMSSKTKALMPVNLFGRLAELPNVDVPILEDAAQSIGTSSPRGLAAGISFFPTKNIGAVGDAGAILTNNQEFFEKIQKLRNHGAKPKYYHALIGGNFRLDALQAAILRVKLPYLEEWNKIRKDNAARYRSAFANSTLPPEFRCPNHVDEHIYHQFTVRAPKRDQLRAYLKSKGISAEVYYPVPLHLQKCFEHLGYKKGDLPHTEKACDEVLSLPIHPTTTAGQQERVVETIESFYKENWCSEQ